MTLSCVALLGTGLPGALAATPDPPAPAPAGGGHPRLQALLDELVAEGASGAMALVDNGSHTTRAAAGSARLDPQVPLRPNARTRVGSITKSFVATVALQLVGERRLRLNDTLERWLPGFVPGGAGITVRQLLNHTSGLFDYTQDEDLVEGFIANPRAFIAPSRLVAAATAHPPLFQPGEGWSYSNTNYVLLGLIAEAVTGRSLARLVTARILSPLHLSGTSLPIRTWRIEGYHAHGYLPPTLTGAGYLDVTDQTGSFWHAAGAAVSTVEDLHRFYSALFSGRLIRPRLLAEMKTTVDLGPITGYGLGVYFLRGPCGTVWGHNGGVPGYRTVAYSDVAGKRSVVVAVPTELDDRLEQLTQLTIDTAICQMFDRVPAAAATGTYQAPNLAEIPAHSPAAWNSSHPE